MIASACLPSYVLKNTVCSKNQEKRCDDFGTLTCKRADRVEKPFIMRFCSKTLGFFFLILF